MQNFLLNVSQILVFTVRYNWNDPAFRLTFPESSQKKTDEN